MELPPPFFRKSKIINLCGGRATNGLCPITRNQVTGFTKNHDLRKANEKLWEAIEELYMEMTSAISQHDVSMFATRKRSCVEEGLEFTKKIR